MKRRSLVILLLITGWHLAGWSQAFAEDYVVATVGNDKIYYSEILQAAERLNKYQKENFDTDRDFRINFIREYAARYAASKKAVEEGLDKDTETGFDIEQMRRGILADKLLSRDLDKISYAEQDVEKYYEQNKSRYQDKERVRVSYIKVSTKDEADKLFARLGKGEKFELVGKGNIAKYPNWIQKDTPMFGPELMGMAPGSLNGLFAFNIGGHSQPVEGGDKNGYFIFRIDEKIPAKDLPYDQVKAQVELEYAKMLKDRAVKAFIGGIFAKEKVVINEGEIK